MVRVRVRLRLRLRLRARVSDTCGETDVALSRRAAWQGYWG